MTMCDEENVLHASFFFYGMRGILVDCKRNYQCYTFYLMSGLGYSLLLVSCDLAKISKSRDVRQVVLTDNSSLGCGCGKTRGALKGCRQWSQRT